MNRAGGGSRPKIAWRPRFECFRADVRYRNDDGSGFAAESILDSGSGVRHNPAGSATLYAERTTHPVRSNEPGRHSPTKDT